MENNKKQFIELIERYEAITIEEIQECFNEYKENPEAFEVYTTNRWAKKLTGFGSITTCTLCLESAKIGKTAPNCKHCVYNDWIDSKTRQRCTKYETYQAISEANTPTDMFIAMKGRARFMRELLNEKGGEQ